MRLAWLTDIHLDHGPLGDIDADGLLVTGDISNSCSLQMHLAELAQRTPLYFVLGNHDYYGSSITGVRQQVPQWAGSWLHQDGPITLGEWQLVGVDGWGDGRIGNAETPVFLNDFLLIEELRGLERQGVNEFADRFDCTWPTTTRHLRVLADAGLVTTTQHGRQRRYHLNTEVIDQIAGTWIDRFRPDDDK